MQTVERIALAIAGIILVAWVLRPQSAAVIQSIAQGSTGLVRALLPQG
jgi:hypothetical protein